MPEISPVQPLDARPGPEAGAAGKQTGTVSRFTVDGSASLENHLEDICGSVLEGVRRLVPNRRLEAILLGGGYGRGEGGVLKTPTGDQPYNDLEFYVFIRGNRLVNRRRFGAALHTLGEHLAPTAGAEVEFHVLSLAHLQASPPNMFHYDLVAGHHWLHGEERLLAGCDHHRLPEALPPSEATRLLMNRCSGLLFAVEKLAHPVFTDADADFVGRNLAKMQLALGDAVLTLRGAYHWSCRERHRRLLSLATAPDWPWLDQVQQHHGEGVRFKLHPRRACAVEKDELLRQHHELTGLSQAVWLWVETRRLKSPFPSPDGYANRRVDKFPDTSRWENCLRNFKAFGPASLLRPDRFRHPRERVLHALARLLWSKSPAGGAAESVGPSPDLIDGRIAAYRRLWSQVQ